MKQLLTCAAMAGMILGAAFGQVDKSKLMTKNAQSPGKEHAPSVRGRHVFGGADALQPDDSVWRLGADSATVLHTDAALDLHGLAVPAGDYSLYIFLDKGKWQLIVNKKTGQWGINQDNSTTDQPADELGRIALTMAKPAALVETLKIDLSSAGGNKGKLQIEWEKVSASLPFTVK
jgi:hypothetical protein